MILPMSRLPISILVGVTLVSGCTDDSASQAPSGELSRDGILAKFVEPDTVHFALPNRDADGTSVETRTTELGVWPCRSFIWDMEEFRLQVAQMRFPENTSLTGEPAEGLKDTTAFIADDPNLTIHSDREHEINDIPAHSWVIEWKEEKEYELRIAVMEFPYVYICSVFADDEDVLYSNSDIVAFLRSIAKPKSSAEQ
jgi:hypothetical protein